jgi:ferredoxin
MAEKIALFYFSGTGNTEYLVKLLSAELTQRGAAVDVLRIEDLRRSGQTPRVQGYSMVGIASPIHAWGTPLIVDRFIKELPSCSLPAFFVYNGAGAEAINDACGVDVERKLAAKGYRVFLDYQFIMPSNWLFSFPRELTTQLADAAPRRAGEIAEYIISGKEIRKSMNGMLFLLLRAAWHSFAFGTRFFGIDLYATKACTRCGKCWRNCPVGNIREAGGKPRFGWKCTWCMRCIYACPPRAIRAHFHSFSIVKDYRNAPQLAAATNSQGAFLKPDEHKGYAGFRRYLFGSIR